MKLFTPQAIFAVVVGGSIVVHGLDHADSHLRGLVSTDFPDLIGVAKGPTTGSGMTELHILDGSKKYTDFTPTGHTATGQHLTAGYGSQWNFVKKSNGDLMAIFKGPNTGSGTTELHVLSAKSNYQDFVLHTGTALHMTHSGPGRSDWTFALDPTSDDLLAINKGPVSGSGQPEVHVLTEKSDYMKIGIQTRLPPLGFFEEMDFKTTHEGNLVAIYKDQELSPGTIFLTILKKSSGYKQTAHFFPYLASGYPEFPSGTEIDFAVLDTGDLMGIFKGPITGSDTTEVHVLSAASNYKDFILQTHTALHYTADAFGNEWTFVV